jgi:ABC-type dipeptide/oligopeptide/nickel transport system ATPase component
LLDEGDLSVVALSRDLPTLAALADRLAVLADGHFVEVGPTDDVLGDPTHPHTRELVAYYDDLDGSLDR